MQPSQPLSRWLDASRSQPVALWQGREVDLPALRHQVLQLCAWLQQQPQTRWALCFEQSYLFLVALLATLHAGKTPVIHGHLRQAQLAEQQHSFDGLLSDIPLSLAVPHLLLPLAQSAPALATLPPVPPQAAVLLYTSGSTGAPREVIKPVSALDEEVRWLQQQWGARLQALQVVATVTHQHLFGLTFRIMLPMALGLTLHSDTLQFSEQLSALPGSSRYLLVSSPAFLRRLDSQLPAPNCALLVSAGGELAESDAAQVYAWLGTGVDEIYGSTETGIMATRQQRGARLPWQPFPAVRFQPRDEGWWVTSPLIADPNGLALDDHLQWQDGAFQLAGRRDRIAKIEDKRVSLSEVERRLRALPGVDDAVVLVLQREGRLALGAAVAMTSPPAARGVISREWRQALRPWLEPVAIPRYWRIVEHLPLNSQSKYDWRQIEELFDVTC